MESKERKAILLVSFGTSVAETRKHTIDAFAALVQRTYPHLEIRQAYTSEVILGILKKRDGIFIDTISEALERLKKDGFTNIIIQPTHIINGIENTRMLHLIHRFKNDFAKIQVGVPLLTTQEDMRQVILAIMADYPLLAADTGVLLLGHGTDHHSNFTYPALEYTARQMGYPHLFIGTIEGYPDVDTVISNILSSTCRTIILLPLLFVAGEHAKNDMAGDSPDSWKSRLVSAGLTVRCVLKGLGEYPAIQDLFLRHLMEAEGKM